MDTNFKLSLKYFFVGIILGVVTLYSQPKTAEAFNFSFPGIPNLPSLISLIPFPSILGLRPLPVLKPLRPFENPFASPTPTLTNTPTPSDTPTPTLTPTPTETPTPTPTLTLTPTETLTPTLTLTPTEVPVLTPTETPTPTFTPIPTITLTVTPTLSAAADHLVINEVFPGGLSEIEWVELFNPTSDPIDVSGWNLFDNSTNDILPASIPIGAGNYAVVVGSGSTVTVPVSAVKIELFSAIGGGLAVSGDRIEMKDTSNITVDALSWGTDNTFFSSPPSISDSGESLSRLPNGFDTDAASDWSSSFSPSVGTTN